MSDLTTYLHDRVDGQILWHSAKARENKAKYHLFQIITIIAGSIVPLINVIDFLPFSTRVISGALGSLITIITSITQLKKYDENWIIYRKTVESLKNEKYLFLHDVGEYSSKVEQDKGRLFVQKIETILISESEMQDKQSVSKQDRKA